MNSMMFDKGLVEIIRFDVYHRIVNYVYRNLYYRFYNIIYINLLIGFKKFTNLKSSKMSKCQNMCVCDQLYRMRGLLTKFDIQIYICNFSISNKLKIFLIIFLFFLVFHL